MFLSEIMYINFFFSPSTPLEGKLQEGKNISLLFAQEQHLIHSRAQKLLLQKGRSTGLQERRARQSGLKPYVSSLYLLLPKSMATAERCHEWLPLHHQGLHPHPELSTGKGIEESLGTSKGAQSILWPDSCDGQEILWSIHSSWFWPLEWVG